MKPRVLRFLVLLASECFAHPGGSVVMLSENSVGSTTPIAAIERTGRDASRVRQLPASAATESVHGTRAGVESFLEGIRLCWCPPGTFQMGSPPDGPGRRPDESRVEVTLTRGFWLGKHELTQGQWKDLSGRKGLPNRDASYSRIRHGGAWMDPAAFCRSALRLRYEPERSSDHIGFRVAVVHTEPDDLGH